MGWIRRNWAEIIAGLAVIPELWRWIRSLITWGGDIDFIIARARDPDWVGAMLSLIVNPPPYLTVPLMVLGVTLIYWDANRRTQRQPARMTTPIWIMVVGAAVYFTGAMWFFVQSRQSDVTTTANPESAAAVVPDRKPVQTATDEDKQRQEFMRTRMELEVAAASKGGEFLVHQFDKSGIGKPNFSRDGHPYHLEISKNNGTSMWVYARAPAEWAGIARQPASGTPVDIRTLRGLRDSGVIEIGQHAFFEMTDGYVLQIVLVGVQNYNAGDDKDEIRLKYKFYKPGTFLIEPL